MSAKKGMKPACRWFAEHWGAGQKVKQVNFMTSGRDEDAGATRAQERA
jgi:hypothetical protein